MHACLQLAIARSRNFSRPVQGSQQQCSRSSEREHEKNQFIDRDQASKQCGNSSYREGIYSYIVYKNRRTIEQQEEYILFTFCFCFHLFKSRQGTKNNMMKFFVFSLRDTEKRSRRWIEWVLMCNCPEIYMYMATIVHNYNFMLNCRLAGFCHAWICQIIKWGKKVEFCTKKEIFLQLCFGIKWYGLESHDEEIEVRFSKGKRSMISVFS